MFKCFTILVFLLTPGIACAATATDIGKTCTAKVGITINIPKTVKMGNNSFSDSLRLSTNFNGRFSLKSINQQDGSIKFIKDYQIQPMSPIIVDDAFLAGNSETYILTPN